MSGLTNVLVAQQVQALLDTQKRQTDYLTAWLGGSPTGGPNNDGRYPFVDLAGVEILVPAPATFNSMVSGPAALSVAAKAAAEFARDLALGHADRANDQRELAEAARGAAVDARNLAQEHRNHAGTHEANARYWAELAQGVGQTSTEDRQIVEQLAEQVADNAALASQDADDAAASAALAATFDPALYDLKSETLAASRLTGVIDRARIPVLPSGRQFASTGGLPQLTSAQQAEIGEGSIVTTTDGMRYVYSGQGSKTVAASYTVLADITPDWDALANKPSFYPSNVVNVAGLQSALDLKAPKASATFTGVTTMDAAMANSFGSISGLFYGDGNHAVIKTGVAGAEKYWRFDSNGFLYALNGGLYANQHIQTMTQFIVGASTDASRAELNKGWLEIRNTAGPYIDLSKDGTTDWHARLQYQSDNFFVMTANGARWITTPQGRLTAISADGNQDGNVLTTHGTEQTLSKQITFPSALNPQDNGASAMLEVKGGGGGYGAWMKFHRPGAYGTYFGMFEDGKWGFGGWSTGSTIYEFWTSKNLNPNTLMRRELDTWNFDIGGNPRFYFGANGGKTYVRGGGFEVRNQTDVWLMNIENNGIASFTNSVSTNGAMTVRGNDLNIYGGSPTIRLVDSDHRSAHIHVNSNRFYVLRGGGVGDTGWASINDGWPLELNLENGDLNTCGQVYAGNGCWFRVRGSAGVYWEAHGGGWTMVDGTWLRSYGDKNIVTGGQMQMGSFTVTSDRRLKTDIVPIPLAQASEIIDATNVYEFTKGGRRMFGMIAQEAREVAPILVSEGADIHDDGDAILSLDQTGYIPVLIAEVRSLRQRVAQLERVVQ
ncbi:tail fiber domain-containing protein [Brevundimonas bullata]|uniref:tail fiber domain-containing protein n=1 Tax=Brevundimonas bullata TaxID=13160 RepID=UPI003D9A6B4C